MFMRFRIACCWPRCGHRARPRRISVLASGALLAGLLVPGLVPATTAPVAVPASEWRFTVRLDGKPIGSHRFAVADAGDGGLAIRSEAQFDVSLLGVPLYRYRHRVDERWAGGCLSSIDARTDDNGRLTEVRGQAEGGRFDLQVRGDGRAASAPGAPAGCLMSFAYWNPALAGQKRLLDPGSGRVEPVAIAAPSAAPTDLGAHGQPVRGLRISGLAQPIDVWYAGDRWVGLDTVVGDGRRLSYRLR
jgi:hypothetical protein